MSLKKIERKISTILVDMKDYSLICPSGLGRTLCQVFPGREILYLVGDCKVEGPLEVLEVSCQCFAVGGEVLVLAGDSLYCQICELSNSKKGNES